MQPFLRYLAPGRLMGAAACCLALAGCASGEYSPNTYASNAVQYANKVEPGAIVGYRQVAISANGNIGAVTGGAAGGVLGSEYGGTPLAAVGAQRSAPWSARHSTMRPVTPPAGNTSSARTTATCYRSPSARRSRLSSDRKCW